MYHDVIEGNLYVSQNEGHDWEKADGIPSGVAVMFMEHPFNNRMVRYPLLVEDCYNMSLVVGLRVNERKNPLPYRRPR